MATMGGSVVGSNPVRVLYLTDHFLAGAVCDSVAIRRTLGNTLIACIVSRRPAKSRSRRSGWGCSSVMNFFASIMAILH